MLKISEQAYGGLREQALLELPVHLIEWWHKNSAAFGPIDDVSAQRWIEELGKEAEFGGIDTDDRLFVYISARVKISAPSAEKYVAIMDVVFSDLPVYEKIKRIEVIALRGHRDG